MAKLESSMFREYDLRGQVNDEQLNEYTVGIIAQAYGTMLRRRNIDVAVVGHDYRPSSEWITETTIQGLVATGINVINLGMALTPMMYLAQYHYQAEGGVMVTASHNPAGWSGFKLALGYSHTLGPVEMEELYQLDRQRRVCYRERLRSQRGFSRRLPGRRDKARGHCAARPRGGEHRQRDAGSHRHKSVARGGL